jgi:iron complex outermembrane receptor protein
VVRAALLSIVLAVATMAMPVSAQAIAQSYHLNIPRQPLDGALKDLAQQTGLQIARFSDTPGGSALVGPLSGDMSADQALTSLLRMSGLTYKVVNDRTIAVLLPGADSAAATSTQASGTDQASPPTSDNGKEGKKSSSEQFRVAQVDQGQSSSASTVEKQGEQAKKASAQLEEVVITGSRIPTAAGQQAVPIRSYTREDIDQSGQTTVADFLNTLPDVSISASEGSAFTAGGGNGNPGLTTVQLHGLPVGTTLVLLDGRRMPTSGAGYFDLSSIPTSSIDRIEVLPVGASAIYGADALGGAVNFILRHDFNGFEADAKLDHAAGLTDTDFSMDWGKSWERGSISLVGTYQDRGDLLGSQRTVTSTTNVPADAPSFILTEACTPGNVYSLNGQNLPGLSAPQAGIPAGISGTPMIQQFAGTAARLNHCNYLATTDLIPEVQREGILLTAHYRVSDAADFFTETLLSHEQIRSQEGTFINASMATLGAQNPYNPFGQPVLVSFDDPQPSASFDSSAYLIRPLMGIRGALASDWHYEATAYFSKDRYVADNPLSNTTTIQSALNSSSVATALNPFSTVDPGAASVIQSLIASAPVIHTEFQDELVDGQVVLHGPLLHLPGGPMEVAVGSEFYREEEESESLLGGVDLSNPYDLHRDAYALFSEARVPLVADHTHPQTGDRLALTLAGRFDHSNDFGGKTTWQSGLVWKATETISFNASYGLSYKAPQLQELGGGLEFTTNFVSYPDPFRGGQSVTPLVVYASNPNLKPETGDSRTLAFVYSGEGLKASITYFDIDIHDYIGQPAPITIIDNPELYAGGVIRAPPTPQDQQLGYLGQITQVNTLYYNYGDVRIAGFDADIRYLIDARLGQFTPSLAVSNIYRWESALLPGAPFVDGVSQAISYTGIGWAPRWKGTATLGWKEGPLSANLAGRYVSKYRDYQDFVTNTNELGNFWTYDLNVRYEVGHALAARNTWFAGTYVSLGSINILNKLPPFAHNAAEFDYTQYDIRGRIVYAQCGLKW